MYRKDFIKSCIEQYGIYKRISPNIIFHVFKKNRVMQMLDEDYDDLKEMGYDYLNQFFDDFLEGKIRWRGENMKYYLGIDGGGTGSRLTGIDESGRNLGYFPGNSTNIKSNSYDVVKNNLETILASFYTANACSAEDCLSICIGTAGADSKDTILIMEKILKKLLPYSEITVVNDAVIALYAMTQGEAGILLNAGTGSIVYGMNKAGEEVRAGGWDYLFGDEGSGYYFAKEAIAASFCSYDGTGETTILEKSICNYLKINSMDEAMDILYDVNKSYIAAMSMLFFECVEANDRVAINILNKGADYLINATKIIARKLGFTKETEFILVYTGGVLKNNVMLQDIIENNMKSEYKNISIKIADKKPVMGAVALAKRKTL